MASIPHSCPFPPQLLLEPSVGGGRLRKGVLQLLQPGHHLPAGPDGKEYLHAGERVIFTTEVNNQTSKCIKAVIFALYMLTYTMRLHAQRRRSRVDSSELLRQEANTHITAFNTTKTVSTFHLHAVLSVTVVVHRTARS